MRRELCNHSDKDASSWYDRHFSSERERKGNPHFPAHIVNKSTFLTQEIRLAQDGHGRGTIAKGNHNFPFEFSLPGSISESVEGIAGSFIVYDMKAVADRGIMAKDLVCRKHIRVIRTLPEDLIDLMDPQVGLNPTLSPCRSLIWYHLYEDCRRHVA